MQCIFNHLNGNRVPPHGSPIHVHACAPIIRQRCIIIGYHRDSECIFITTTQRCVWYTNMFEVPHVACFSTNNIYYRPIWLCRPNSTISVVHGKCNRARCSIRSALSFGHRRAHAQQLYICISYAQHQRRHPNCGVLMCS